MDSLTPAVGPHSILHFEVIHCKGLRVGCAHRKTRISSFFLTTEPNCVSGPNLQGQQGQSCAVLPKTPSIPHTSRMFPA